MKGTDRNPVWGFKSRFMRTLTTKQRLYDVNSTNREAEELANVEAWFRQPADLRFELDHQPKQGQPDA